MSTQTPDHSWNQKAVNSQNLALHKNLIKYSAAPLPHTTFKPSLKAIWELKHPGAWAADSPSPAYLHETFCFPSPQPGGKYTGFGLLYAGGRLPNVV